ncbi:MAG TPA: YfhO family protein [Bacteroidota bacterium]|nr:YfhO family protein [Bacteroidota bacterium]
MTKVKHQKASLKKQTEKEFSFDIFPKKYETWICIGIIVVLLLVFYNEIVFKGKVFASSDNIASMSFTTFGKEAKEQGIFPLWIPYVFGGMPSYGSLMTTGVRWWDFSQQLVSYIFSPITAILPNIGMVLYYIIFGLSMFAFIYNKLQNKYVALFTSIAVVLSTSIVGWIVDGHNTKIVTIAFFPIILLFVDLLIKKMNWLYVAILAITLHIIFEATHIQMIFYCYMFLGIYLVYYLIRNLKIRENLLGALRAIGILVLVSGIAFLMSADRYFSTYEYSKYSIRGSSPLKLSNENNTKSQTTEGGGLSYDYATNWSFGPEEVMTFFIPGYYGSGMIEYKGPQTNNQLQKFNLYFGPMMFTNAPQYMGVVVLILALFGIYYYRKEIFVQALLIISIVSLFISFGRELPILYNLMFYHFPYFDKFRVPVMILILLQISVPILAGYGLMGIIDIIKNKKYLNFEKKFLYLGLIIVGFLFITLVAKDVVVSVYKGSFDSAIQSNSDNSFVEYIKKADPNQYRAIFEIASEVMIKDLTFSLVFTALFFILTYLLLRKKINWGIYFSLILLIVVFDLWRIDSRIVDPHTKQEQESVLAKPDWVEFLEQDKSLYRIIELNQGQPNTSNIPAYFKLQNIYGYNPAKLRIIQDVIENCDIRNPLVLDLFNTKYIISDVPYQNESMKIVYQGKKSGMNVIENLSVLPRAFFVNRYEVKDKYSIINNLKNASFNPKEVAYLENDPGEKVDSLKGTETAKVTSFGIHHISFDVFASGKNLLFVSEVYYPAGWKAYLDGNEIPIYKTNYLWRSVIIPQGNHKLEMRFEPESFKKGMTISMILNVLIVGVFIAYLIIYGIRYYNKKKVVK